MTVYAKSGLVGLRCWACANDRGDWCRVATIRGGRVLWSDLSWALAARLVPALLARYGYRTLPPGLFAGVGVDV